MTDGRTTLTRGLEALDITKDYAGNRVLLGVSLEIRPGEVVGLVGHNGAGKSTLLKVLSGAHRASSGELLIDGREVHFQGPSDAIDCGVSTVYQELSLLGNLTVSQNVWLGRELRSKGMLDQRMMRSKALDLVHSFGLDVDPDAKVGTYSTAVRQLLEIAIALSRGTRYLLLDEPTTALEGDQVAALLKYIRRLATERQVGVLIVDHKLDELYDVADRIVALMNGKIVIDAAVESADRHEVVAAIAGQEYEADRRNDSHSRDGVERSTVLKVSGLRSGALHGVSFTAHEGEILGVYGLGGSGRSEMLRALAGIEPAMAGSIEINGSAFLPRSPAEAMRHGVSFLTEERKSDGIVPQMNCVRNAALPVLERFTRRCFLREGALRNQITELLKQLNVKGDLNAPIISLSGGNQQKVVLAKALVQNPTLLLLDEPTKGVDIGAKSEIHRLLRELAHSKHQSIVMVSSEEEEILELADNVIVFVDGRVAEGPLPAGALTVPMLRELAWSDAHGPDAIGGVDFGDKW
ncbi:sugar ABC transporter ATP-binding protein [Actinomyces ruminis]|uniref:Sugar ABC transporter ATP-binding protein n=1 Tax=Actinomyces ruminis TaxID=1937003 RepID=A0ABX4M8A1_9ACTO|nr:sugar ABC transporter ATP-binding protein [Actinomyces ruminis]PHP51319.1 sugar ABC transporter ATP-binding protein [Actinomyces ruminis]